MKSIRTALDREASDVLSPAWHRDVLLAREQRIADGT
jgi:hypothetical protein